MLNEWQYFRLGFLNVLVFIIKMPKLFQMRLYTIFKSASQMHYLLIHRSVNS